MRRIFPHAAAVALAAALASPVAAQDGGAARSLAFTTSGSNGTIGYFQRLSPRAELGVEVGLHRQDFESDADELASTSVQVAPVLKLRGARMGPFAPYTWLSAGLDYTTSNSDQGANESEIANWGALGQAALGLEWLPASSVAVGAHAGLSLRYGKSDAEINGNDAGDRSSWDVGTFTSGVRVQIYF